MFNLFTDYITWHYTYALLNILRLAKEFVRFFLNLFSVTLFFKTLFLPIFSIPVDNTDESFYIADAIASFIGGLIIRIIGAFFRLLLITLGLFLSALTLVFFAVVFVLWLAMPLVFVMFVYYLVTLSLTLL